jgi:hypothetical protein
MDDRLVYNAIRTPDGTVLVSYSRHDYKTYTDANGHEYADMWLKKHPQKSCLCVCLPDMIRCENY